MKDKTMITITSKDFLQKVRSLNGKTFSVSFVKKTTGEIRHMTARLGVQKGVKGVRSNAASDKTHNVMTCYEMKGKESSFKRINLSALVSAQIDGVAYRIKDSAK